MRIQKPKPYDSATRFFAATPCLPVSANRRRYGSNSSGGHDCSPLSQRRRDPQVFHALATSAGLPSHGFPKVDTLLGGTKPSSSFSVLSRHHPPILGFHLHTCQSSTMSGPTPSSPLLPRLTSSSFTGPRFLWRAGALLSASASFPVGILDLIFQHGKSLPD